MQLETFVKIFLTVILRGGAAEESHFLVVYPFQAGPRILRRIESLGHQILRLI